MSCFKFTMARRQQQSAGTDVIDGVVRCVFCFVTHNARVFVQYGTTAHYLLITMQAGRQGAAMDAMDRWCGVVWNSNTNKQRPPFCN
jgi:hypothetical protein